jgi:hypothetical protein
LKHLIVLFMHGLVSVQPANSAAKRQAASEAGTEISTGPRLQRRGDSQSGTEARRLGPLPQDSTGSQFRRRGRQPPHRRPSWSPMTCHGGPAAHGIAAAIPRACAEPGDTPQLARQSGIHGRARPQPHAQGVPRAPPAARGLPAAARPGAAGWPARRTARPGARPGRHAEAHSLRSGCIPPRGGGGAPPAAHRAAATA